MLAEIGIVGIEVSASAALDQWHVSSILYVSKRARKMTDHLAAW